MNTLFVMSTLILSGGQVLLGLAAVGAAIYLGIFATKTYLQQQSLKINNGDDLGTSSLVRKHEMVDLKKHQANIKLAGFASAMAIVMIIFAWTQFTSEQVLAEFFPEPLGIEMDIPPTPAAPKELPPVLPPPAPKPNSTFVESDIIEEPKKDDVVEDPIISTTPSDYTGPTDKNSKAMPFVIEPEPKKEVVKDDTNEIILVPEQMPRFPGCEDQDGDNSAKKSCADSKMLAFIYKNITYPPSAIEIGIEGTAVISFVVMKDGTIGDLAIVKDPGGGCGKEALRVVKLMDKLPQNWTPGKQRGKAVNVRYNLPVKFKLNN